MSGSAPNNQCVFFLAVGEDGVPMLILGITEQSWEYMKAGKTHNFDFVKVGMPLRVMMFGAKDQAEAMATIDRAAKENGIAYFDERGKDFNIDDKRKKH